MKIMTIQQIEKEIKRLENADADYSKRLKNLYEKLDRKQHVIRQREQRNAREDRVKHSYLR